MANLAATVKPTQADPGHQQRVSRVCNYVQHNLDEALDLDRLCNVAGCSKFRFHRIFSAFTGIGLARYVQLSRLKRASYRLAFENELKIIDIALEAGFNTPEGFSRTFKRTFDQTPSQFRAQPDWSAWHARFQHAQPRQGNDLMKVEIKQVATTEVAYIEHQGDPRRVFDTAGRFIAWRKSTGLSPISQSDTLGDTLNALYRDWLPGSGEQPRDFPCYFHYLNFIHQVDECDLLTDIYLPLQ
ncbi:AraC family transcriptional regulator [Ferrimonas sediminicola]|uniref:AraC family transcriptional regulator n=1 Tax=Ferrimonas sediminicola TaxID=2569538 RepID=A0A4U1BHM3_9GAMM|nr:helix-turn-helix domain-containing protein [Ferrimonas sediminicola]TKB50266.1 AraC family transcriptional regulator [Ferrimonas sediminicola]